MKSLADQLPPEIAKQIHPDWRKNEAAYWAIRDQLINQYRNQWIGFADGAVVAAGTSPVDVFHAAVETGLHPFVICVGREEEPCRIRHSAFPFDAQYPGEALPVANVEFRRISGSAGLLLDRVIPDTGADGTTLPWPDCQRLQLDVTMGIPGLMASVGGGSATTVAFTVWFTSMGVNTGVGCMPILRVANESLAAMF